MSILLAYLCFQILWLKLAGTTALEGVLRSVRNAMRLQQGKAALEMALAMCSVDHFDSTIASPCAFPFPSPLGARNNGHVCAIKCKKVQQANKDDHNHNGDDDNYKCDRNCKYPKRVPRSLTQNRCPKCHVSTIVWLRGRGRKRVKNGTKGRKNVIYMKSDLVYVEGVTVALLQDLERKFGKLHADDDDHPVRAKQARRAQTPVYLWSALNNL